MGCNCNRPKPRPRSGSGARQSFALIDGNKRQTFGSRLEAEAEFIRNGKRGHIKPI